MPPSQKHRPIQHLNHKLWFCWWPILLEWQLHTFERASMWMTCIHWFSLIPLSIISNKWLVHDTETTKPFWKLHQNSRSIAILIGHYAKISIFLFGSVTLSNAYRLFSERRDAQRLLQFHDESFLRLNEVAHMYETTGTSMLEYIEYHYTSMCIIIFLLGMFHLYPIFP